MTDAQKSTVLTLRSKGMSFSKIAETVGLSVNTIKSFCSRHSAFAAASQSRSRQEYVRKSSVRINAE